MMLSYKNQHQKSIHIVNSIEFLYRIRICLMREQFVRNSEQLRHQPLHTYTLRRD